MDVIGIRLGVTPRTRHCDPAGLPLEVGEACVVDTEHGVQFGTVVAPIIGNPFYKAGARLPKVIRRASRDDEEAYARKLAAEQDARAFCLAKIAERRVPLKLGLVDRQLDGRKMTFYFTSEGRIDFRDLVRDLSTQYNARIEMRQIGDREDAAMKGGCGPCGKQLCCSTFLKGFEPISIKMAKAQGLSLNPSKISGMCGRLMCCLKYEYDPETKAPKKKAGGCAGCSVNRGPSPVPPAASTTPAHVHAGALGWVGFMSFGMIYWLMPRLFQTPLWSKNLMDLHFWVATVGILLYIVAIYAAGLTQGLMWRAFDDTGRLAYPDFVETTLRLIPMYWARVVGGTLYLAGTVLCGVNLLMTWRRRPAVYEEPVHEAPALERGYVEPALEPTELERKKAPVTALGIALDKLVKAAWHRRWEGLPLTFTVWVVIACVTASLFEIIPMFLIRSNVPAIATVKPYTPLELAGRDVYIAEGCNNCHSQMIRPIRAETVRYGEYSKPGEFVYDHPFLWGSRRIGPDLQRIGGKYPSLWHVRHFENPRSVTPQSIMPNYAWLLATPLDFEAIPRHVEAQQMVGVPYTDADIKNARLAAKTQAAAVAKDIADQGGPKNLEGKQVVALIAYLQRLGRDIQALPPAASAAPAAK